MDKTIVLRPRLSEKTYGLSSSRVYVVEVPRGVNKLSVAKAIEAQFEVKVQSVNLTNIPGKTKRTINASGKRMLNANGRRSDVRKAYVTLAEGHSLPFFAAVEEEVEQEEKVQKNIDKAAAKADKKADKKAAKTEAKPKKESK